MKFIEATLFDLPFKNEEFDCCVSLQVIEHISETQDYLREMNRVLKKGSTVYITTPNKESRLEENEKPFNRFHPIEFTGKELRIAMSQQFKNVKIWGLRATEEIEEIEQKRITRIKKLVKKDFLGLRRYVPQWAIDFMVKKQSVFNKDKYSIGDFYLSEKESDIKKSIDLYAEAVK